MTCERTKSIATAARFAAFFDGARLKAEIGCEIGWLVLPKPEARTLRIGSQKMRQSSGGWATVVTQEIGADAA